MPRILCFSGREHHYQKLKSVVNLLREGGAEVGYLISDNTVQNNDTAMEYLIPAGEQPIHAMQFFDKAQVPTVTAQTLDLLRHIMQNGSTLESDLFAFVEPYWIAASVREAVEVLTAFRNCLDQTTPDCLIILHEANFWTKLLAYLAHERGIPVVSFQEGLLRHRDQATVGKFNLSCEYSTKVLMWSEGAKDAYVKSGIPAEKLEVVGMSHLDVWHNHLTNITLHGGVMGTLEQWKAYQKAQMGFNPDAPLVLLAPPLISRMDGNGLYQIGLVGDWSANTLTQVALRLHPFEAQGYIDRLQSALSSHPRMKVITEGDTLALALASDVVLTQHTTVAVEALALGVGVMELDLENVGVLESLAEQKVAIRVGGGEMSKVEKFLRGDIGVNPADLHAWRERNIGPRDGKASQRAVDIILGLAGTHA